MKTQKVLWDCEQIPTLMQRLCLDPVLWLNCLLEIHVGILTCKVMFCFNQIKETEESKKCKWKSQSPQLPTNLMNTWTRSFFCSSFHRHQAWVQAEPCSVVQRRATKYTVERPVSWSIPKSCVRAGCFLKCIEQLLLPSHSQELQDSSCLWKKSGSLLWQDTARLSLSTLFTVWGVTQAALVCVSPPQHDHLHRYYLCESGTNSWEDLKQYLFISR